MDLVSTYVDVLVSRVWLISMAIVFSVELFTHRRLRRLKEGEKGQEKRLLSTILDRVGPPKKLYKRHFLTGESPFQKYGLIEGRSGK